MTNNPAYNPAVRASRAEPPDALDDFPTPPWATRALVNQLYDRWDPHLPPTVWEPAANRGYMVRTLEEYGCDVTGSDIFDYGAGFDVVDFLGVDGLKLSSSGLVDLRPDWVITNPPFKDLEKWIDKSIPIARQGVALLCRTQCLEGVERYKLWKRLEPFVQFYQFAERVKIVRGRVESGSTATAYMWVVIWKSGRTGNILKWIPPCRAELERAGDYAE